MKQHTNGFKNNVKEMGRQISSILSYDQAVLQQELYSATMWYEGNILKSVMKTLEIESSVDIPLEKVVNFQFGVLVDDDYEFLDYGNYVVVSSEKQEDTNTYKITCKDKIVYSMKPYENIGVVYPITVKDYMSAICNHLGIGFGNIASTFANWNKVIPNEKYLDASGNDLGYTFRDVLDELAEVTGSTICINENDELEVRYITPTNDTIDKKFLKDVNVTFGQKYGPINSIVLSRSGNADNVYLQDEQSIENNGLCELRISDNQIMNDNNRSEYLPDLLARLGGLEYYINDYSSTGICYYDVCDRYNVQVDEQSYSCIMLNDEIDITQGIEESIYTEMPEQTKTDYEKSDKTDQKINQTYFMVDKQNQVIESVITNVTEQNNKISQITQTVDELNSKISDFADLTISGETSYATLNLDGINESEPIEIKVRPVSENISYWYPNTGLFPDLSLFLKTRTIRFTNTDTNEVVEYELPDDLLFYDSEHYDEFYLNYESQTCQVTKRCKYNEDGTVSLLDNEIVTDYPYPSIYLNDGDYTIELLGYNYGYLTVRLMSANIYTTQFATKAEVSSEISQTSQQITADVDAKFTNYSTTTEMNSAIALKANEITSTVSSTYETKTSATQNYSQLRQTDQSITSTVATKVGNNEIISKINQSPESITINANKISLAGKTIALTSDNIKINSTNFSVTKDGNITAKGGTIGGAVITSDRVYMTDAGFSSNTGAYSFWAGENNGEHGSANTDAKFKVDHLGNLFATSANISGTVNATSGSFVGSVTATSGTFNGSVNLRGSNSLTTYNSSGYIANKITPTGLRLYNNTGSEIGYVTAGYNTIDGTTYNTVAVRPNSGGGMYAYTQGIFVVGTVHTTSLESEKKNIEKYDKSALNEILNSDIYKYDFKTEEDDTQKHIGVVIGKGYKASKDVSDDSGVDLYSMIAVAWKAIQEQQKQIDELKLEIEKLKGEK